MPVLRGLSGDVQGQVFELPDGETTIGRHNSNMLQIDDLSVSSFHCCIDASAGSCTVRDLQSTNGTQVDGQKVTVRPLTAGCVLQVGSLEFLFEDEAAPSTAPRRPVPVRQPRPSSPDGDATKRVGFTPARTSSGKSIWVALVVVGGIAVLGVVVLLVFLFGLGGS